MKLVRFLLLVALLVIVEAAAATEQEEQKQGGCKDKASGDACTRSDQAKSRKKRVVSLPNQSSFTMQSRLIVPQPPVGLYIIWVRIRFFLRSMFTEAVNT